MEFVLNLRPKAFADIRRNVRQIDPCQRYLSRAKLPDPNGFIRFGKPSES